MKNRTRTAASIKNISFSLITQFLTILLNYICRYFFIKALSSEYLGVSGLFTNILTVFSLAELGIGSAIVYAMYKPISDKDLEKIKAYMNFYKKCYVWIAGIILVVGLALTPYLDFFIKDTSGIQNLEFIYFLYLIDSVSSYLFVYKASILNAMQENYICNIYQSICKILMSIIMIIALIIFKNFILYLTIQIAFKFLTNILISRKANQMYPYIKDTKNVKLAKSERKSIFKNVYALFCNQIGNVIILGTDNIIISKYVGLIATGLYSNYYLITNSLSNIVGQIFNSLIASVGNLVASEDKEHVYETYNKIFFLNFGLTIIFITILSCVIQEFISFSFGNKYLLDNFTTIIILINFYLLLMKNVVGTFRYAMGLFEQDKYCNFIRAIINIVVSIILAQKCGIVGVFLGTLISDLLVTFWYQPYILYRIGFNKKAYLYFKDYLIYTITTLFSIGLSMTIFHFIKINNGFVNLILGCIVGLLISSLTIIVFYHRSVNYQYFKNFILDNIKKIKNKIFPKKKMN